jgi:hypothetical protein
MPISAAYERTVPAKLYVHIEGETPFEASEADLINFGYIKVEPEPQEIPEQAQEGFDPTPLLRAGAKFGAKALKAVNVAKDVTTTIVREKMNDKSNTPNKDNKTDAK